MKKGCVVYPPHSVYRLGMTIANYMYSVYGIYKHCQKIYCLVNVQYTVINTFKSKMPIQLNRIQYCRLG